MAQRFLEPGRALVPNPERALEGDAHATDYAFIEAGRSAERRRGAGR